MFTGIIIDLGKLRTVEQRGDTRFTIETGFDATTLGLGASVACSGACLTVVDKGTGWFAVDVSAETLSKTTHGAWEPGQAINLERALCLGDELGGHMVSGHVDGVAEVRSVRVEGDSQRFVFSLPPDLAHYIAVKGSVTLDGVSLTVNEVEDASFGVNIIAHTAAVTTFGNLRPGDRVNLEIDLVSRYLERLLTK
jgi:riboflavin synthase